MALILALVFLLALTVLGVAAMATSDVEAKMSYAFNDSGRAFQGAEAGVAAGERWLDAQSVKPAAGGSCNAIGAPLCLVWDAESGTQIADWFSFAWSAKGRSYDYDYSQTGPPIAAAGRKLPRAATPHYVIEEIGREPGDRYYYRITAESRGAQDGARAIVQSVMVKSYGAAAGGRIGRITWRELTPP